MQKLKLISLEGKPTSHFIAVVTLNKPNQANALDQEMMQNLTDEFQTAKADPNCRALVVIGEGKHFCAGAHLKWMQHSAALGPKENVEEAHRLTAMFDAIATCPFPTVAAVRGAAFGGGVGLASVCDTVLATRDAKFCLSEVNLGLIPAVILPYLHQRMPLGQLQRFGLTGDVIPEETLLDSGLVDILVAPEQFHKKIHELLDSLVSSGSDAQKTFKSLLSKLGKVQNVKPVMAQAIADVRAGEEAKLGLEAFFKKEKAPWSCKLAEPFVCS